MSCTLAGALALQMPAWAQGMPTITPSLKHMLAALPIADIKDDVQGMVKTLKKTSCGSELKDCYSTKSGPLQLYFFTSKGAQQTFLLVINKKMPMPSLLKPNVQKLMGGTYLSDPIISISTTDFDLDMVKMPADLQKVVRDSYFNVSSLTFASGVQLAARAELGGVMKVAMEGLGVKADQLTLRAGVLIPIPTDLVSGAGAGAGLADALKHSDTMKKAGADAVSPEAYIEFQFAPSAKLPMRLPPMDLTDATFFIDNALTFGYKGNAYFKGVKNKKILIQFQTPLTPLGAMDLLDFSFRMATPPDLTLEDAANVMVAMATPDKRLAAYGGFINRIDTLKKPLLAAAAPLSVFQLRNPQPHADYKFGDSSKPFPTENKYFNVALLGPTAPGGPLMQLAGDAMILGQPMGSIDVAAGTSGFHGKVARDLSLKLGPLGKVTIEKMLAEADIDKDSQRIRLKGNFGGQVVEVVLDGTMLTINVPANCVNPFEIKTQLKIEASSNIATIFEGQGGANVDPSKISGCIGKELEAAYKKIGSEYKNMSGYSANEANQALEGLRVFDTRIIQTWSSLGVNNEGDVVRGQLRKVGNQVNKATCRLSGNCKKKKKVSEVCMAVLDEEFYARKYTTQVAGNEAWHWAESSACKTASKQGSAEFEVAYYFDHNRTRYGFKGNESPETLTKHWLDHGRSDGVQGSADFNIADYRDQNPGIWEAMSSNWLGVWDHWLKSGINEGRPISREFRATEYLALYPDLQQLLGANNYPAAFDHWVITGKAEGRKGRTPGTVN